MELAWQSVISHSIIDVTVTLGLEAYNAQRLSSH